VSSSIEASASYFLAAISAATDDALADEVFQHISELLPYHLRPSLEDGYAAAQEFA
jgi:hypothetical protein